MHTTLTVIAGTDFQPGGRLTDDKKDTAEEPIVTILSAATSQSTTAYNTPDILTPKDEKEALEFHGLSMAAKTASGNDAAPNRHELDVEAVTKLRRKQKLYEYFCLGSFCFSLFVSGWGDGSNGPLIPRLQEHYQASPVHYALTDIHRAHFISFYRSIILLFR